MDPMFSAFGLVVELQKEASKHGECEESKLGLWQRNDGENLGEPKDIINQAEGIKVVELR